MANHDQPGMEKAKVPLTHDEIRALLPEYVSDLVLRTTRPEVFAAIEAHVHSCPDCTAEVAELADLLHEAVSGELPAARSYPAFTLDFLRRRRSLPFQAPWLLDDLGRLVIRFSEVLLAQIRTNAVMLRSGEQRRGAVPPLYQYDHARFETQGAPPQPTLTISIFGVAADPSLVDVVVRVGAGGRRNLDLSGSEVTLTLGEEVQIARTDRFGYAYFRALPSAVLPGMEVSIAPDSRTV